MATDCDSSVGDITETEKLRVAAGLVCAAHGDSWAGESGDAVKAAAKYLIKVLGSGE